MNSPIQNLQTKPIYLNNEARYIVMQHKNGNCPLIALINYASLQNRIELPKTVTPEELLNIAAEVFPDMISQISEHSRELLKGSFVDPKFSSIYDFQECFLTKFPVKVVHGWVLDPMDPLSEKLESYNQATMLMTTENDLDAVDFLNCNQLTINGLQMLHELEPTPWMGISFRNNHFNVLYKRGPEQLFQLVTDEGFRNTSITWESLTLDGDSLYYDSDFYPREPEQVQEMQNSGSGDTFSDDVPRESSKKKRSCVLQ